MNLGPSTGTHPRGLQRGRGAKGRIHPYAWLAAGALVLGAAAVAGSGNAHADAVSGASASEAAGRAGPAAKPSVRDSAQRGRGAVTAAKTVSASAAVPVQSPTPAFGRGAVTAGSASGGKAPSTTAAPSCGPNTCGYTSFQYTGGPQTWAPPAGVNTAYFSVQGGNGTSDCEACGLAVPIFATVTLNDGFFPTPVTAMTIVVGGDGQPSGSPDGVDPRPGGAGGYNGGGSGGSGSVNSYGGGGGGGASTVAISAGGPPGAGIVLVGGGGGGGGGDSYTDDGAPVASGGPGGTGGLGPASGGAWAGGSGIGAPGDNGGGGGAGSNQATQNGSNGEDADNLTGNGGGGGGGGGWQGGSGGQAGQSGYFGTAGAGGGGGGGSSYANPLFTANVSVVPGQAMNSVVAISWVQILTTRLTSMRAGQPTNQQLSAIYEESQQDPPTWQVTGGLYGSLPAGLALSPTGQLTGSPQRSGRYSFQVTVTSSNGFATSVVTYSGTVCGRRCGSRR